MASVVCIFASLCLSFFWERAVRLDGSRATLTPQSRCIFSVFTVLTVAVTSGVTFAPQSWCIFSVFTMLYTRTEAPTSVTLSQHHQEEARLHKTQRYDEGCLLDSPYLVGWKICFWQCRIHMITEQSGNFTFPQLASAVQCSKLLRKFD